MSAIHIQSISARNPIGDAGLPTDPIPLFGTPVSAGFPSPADGYVESTLDLNGHCISNPISTYFARISGDEWGSLGVSDGDELIVDLSLDPLDGSLVLADMDGARSLFKVARRADRVSLIDGFDREYGAESDFQIWGVVTFIIRSLR